MAVKATIVDNGNFIQIPEWNLSINKGMIREIITKDHSSIVYTLDDEVYSLDSREFVGIPDGETLTGYMITYANDYGGDGGGGEQNVNADWDAVAGDALILNKPANLTDLDEHSVTELSDITDAGSGAIITTTERTKLDTISDNAEENVQSDWDATTGDALILNKPVNATTIEAGFMSSVDKTKLDGIEDGSEVNVNADWDSIIGDSFIENKPVNVTTTVDGFMSAVDKTKLDGIAEGSEVNVNADWDATIGDAFIENKPNDITDLSVHTVTNLSDVTEAGSGEIITTDERTSLNAVQGTGILSGGAITGTLPGTTLDWTAGTGQIVDHSDPSNPITIPVSFAAGVGWSPTLTEDTSSLIAINAAGLPNQILIEDFANLDHKNYVIIGAFTHSGGQIVRILDTPFDVAYGVAGSFGDFVTQVIGPANIDGNEYYGNADLTLGVLGGNAFIQASNFRNDPKIPDILTLPSHAVVPTVLQVYNQADPDVTIELYNSTTGVNPNLWDDGSGTLQSVSTDYWTIQRIFRSRQGDTYVSFGQQEFATKELAVEALGNESFIEKVPLSLTLFRCSLIIQQGSTILNDTDQAEFHHQGSFRLGGVSSSGSSIPGVTTPGGVDGSLQFNSTSTFGGSDSLLWDNSGLVVGRLANSGDFALDVLGDVTIEGDLSFDGNLSISDAIIFPDGSTQEYGSTPDDFKWHPITARYTQEYDLAGDGGLSNPYGFYMSPNGVDLYATSSNTQILKHFILSTPWSISTATENYSLDVSANVYGATGIYFSDNGETMFMSDGSYNYIHTYTLTTPWDLSTATWLRDDTFTEISTAIFGIYFSPTGEDFYVCDNGNDVIRHYSLTTPWDLSTGTYVTYLDTDGETEITGVFFKPDGRRVFWVGYDDSIIRTAYLHTPWSFETYTNDTDRYKYTGDYDAYSISVFISPTASKMYVLGAGNENIYEFDLGLAVEGNFRGQVHVWEESTHTDGNCGMMVEQAGTGNAGLHFLLTGGQEYSMGIRNSDDYFVITTDNAMTNHALEIDTSGNTYFSGDVAIDGILTVSPNINSIIQTGDANSRMDFIADRAVATNAAIVFRNDVDDLRYLTLLGNGKAGYGIYPLSKIHTYEDSAGTGTGAGITIEQDGLGDSLLQFLLTDGQRWVMGIDNSDDDKFKIASSEDLDTDAQLTLEPDLLTVNKEIYVHSTGDAGITIAGDTNNSGEDFNASLLMSHDGGGGQVIFGLNGTTDAKFVDAIANGAYIQTRNGSNNLTFQIATGGTPDLADGIARLTIDADGNFGFNKNNPNYSVDILGDVLITGNLFGQGDNFFATETGGAWGFGDIPASDYEVSMFNFHEDSIDEGPTGLAGLSIIQNDTTYGDAALNFKAGTGATWTWYIDQSDNNKLKLYNGIGGAVLEITEEGMITGDIGITLDAYGGSGTIQNYIEYSHTFEDASWPVDYWNLAASAIVLSTTETAPDGSATATQINITSSVGSTVMSAFANTGELSVGSRYTGSMWIRHVSGNDTLRLFFDYSNAGAQVITATSEWTRFQLTQTISNTAATFDIYSDSNDDGVFEFWGAQVVDGSNLTPFVPSFGPSGKYLDWKIASTGESDVGGTFVVSGHTRNQFVVSASHDRIYMTGDVVSLGSGEENEENFIMGDNSYGSIDSDNGANEIGYNTIIGNEIGDFKTQGEFNTQVGYANERNQSTGDWNLGVGAYTGYDSSTSYNNTLLIGNYAGAGDVTAIEDYDFRIGHSFDSDGTGSMIEGNTDPAADPWITFNADYTGQLSKNIVIINKPEDLPGYGTGTITLEAGVQYYGWGKTNYQQVDDQIVMNTDTKMLNFAIILTHSQAITSQDGTGFMFQDCALSYDNDGGTLFYHEAAGGRSRLTRTSIWISYSLGAGTSTVFDWTHWTANSVMVFDNYSVICSGVASGDVSILGTIKNASMVINTGRLYYNSQGLELVDCETVFINSCTWIGANAVGCNVLSITGDDTGGIMITSFTPTLQSNEYGLYLKPGVDIDSCTIASCVPIGVTDNFFNDTVIHSGTFTATSAYQSAPLGHTITEIVESDTEPGACMITFAGVDVSNLTHVHITIANCTNTNYNGTWLAELVYVSGGANSGWWLDLTGMKYHGDAYDGVLSYDLTLLTVPSHSFGTSDADIVLKTDQSILFDANCYVAGIDATTLMVDIPYPATATGTETGTYEERGLNETDPVVKATGNTYVTNSQHRAFGSVDDALASTSIVGSAYLPMNFGADAISEHASTRRWKLIDAQYGIWQYLGLEKFTGDFELIATIDEPGTDNDIYRFKEAINGVNPIYDTDDEGYYRIELRNVEVVIPMVFPLDGLVRGDTVQVMVSGVGTADAVITYNAKFRIRGD